MAGYYDTQVRRAMLTVGDGDVLNEMATGWRASIRDLNTVDDRLKAGINGLRDRDQLGEATRDAAVGAFRDMRGYVAEQRLMLAKTAQALDVAGGAVSQVKSLIRAWDKVGTPVGPGPAPVPDPAAADQTAYWNQANAHRRATDDHTQQLQQREEEARLAWDSLNRSFVIAEDKIRAAHAMPRDEGPEDPPVWPPPGWPGPPPEEPDPEWPPLPPWPPVRETPDRGPATGPGHPTDRGPGASPTSHPAPETHVSHPQPGPGSGHPQGPTTTVSGSSQSGVAYAPGAGGAPTPGGAFAAPAAGASGISAGVAGMAGAAGASAGMAMRGGAAAAAASGAGSAGRSASGAGSAGRSASGAGAAGRAGHSGQAGQGARSSRGGRAGIGGKGSQQASGQAKSGRGGAGSGGGGGARGGRRKDGSTTARGDLLPDDDQWLDGEGTAPDVLR